MERPKKMWGINVVLFILASFLAVTGLVNAWILPRGYEAKGSVLVDIRHFLVTCHEWVGLLFIITVSLHLLLHNEYIRKNLQKYGWTRWIKK